MVQKEYCTTCSNDATRFCSTCGKNFCGKHIGTHLHPKGQGAGIG